MVIKLHLIFKTFRRTLLNILKHSIGTSGHTEDSVFRYIEKHYLVLPIIHTILKYDFLKELQI